MAKPIDQIGLHELTPTLKALAKADGTTGHADWIRSGDNAALVVRFINQQRGGRIFCSFCGKSQDDVEVMIQGSTPNICYICDGCVKGCSEIIEEKRAGSLKRDDEFEPASTSNVCRAAEEARVTSLLPVGATCADLEGCPFNVSDPRPDLIGPGVQSF